MSYEMSIVRKEDLSLYHYIKEVVLLDFIEVDEMVPLVYAPKLSSVDNDADPLTNILVYTADTNAFPNPIERGRGWVYFDTVSGTTTTLCQPYTIVSGTRADGVPVVGTPEQSQMVTVYDSNLNVVNDSSYMIDYIDGRIVTDDSSLNLAYVTYHWYYVSIVDEWETVQSASPPIVVIDIFGTDKSGYQLGAGKKVFRKVNLHIFASNSAERKDIGETLYDGLYLKSCPLYDFPLGDVLEYDGTFYGRKDNPNKLTSLFDRTSDKNVIGNLEFENVSARNIGLPPILSRNREEVMSDLNAYRSRVSFDLVSYTYS